MRYPKLEIIKRNYNNAPHRDRSTSIVDGFKDKLNAKDLTHIPKKKIINKSRGKIHNCACVCVVLNACVYAYASVRVCVCARTVCV